MEHRHSIETTTDVLGTEADCGICLASHIVIESKGSNLVYLACLHKYCLQCLTQYVELKLQHNNTNMPCPTCNSPIDRATLVSIFPPHLIEMYDDVVSSGAAIVPMTSNVQNNGDALSPEDLQAFRIHAKQRHLKYCPACHAAIEKNGGCNSMTCRCGARFRWDKARTVVPCNQLHFLSSSGLSKYLCTTCVGCTVLAYVKLFLWRCLLLTIGGPIAFLAFAFALPFFGVYSLIRCVRSKVRQRKRVKAIQRRQQAMHRNWMEASQRVVFVGNEGVGKTQLIANCGYGYDPEPLTEDTTHCRTPVITTDGQPRTFFLINALDTILYRSLRVTTYSNSRIFVAVFNIAEPATLVDLEQLWIPETREFEPLAVILLVGTHADLRPTELSLNRDYVSLEQGKDVARRNELVDYLETSLDPDSARNLLPTLLEAYERALVMHLTRNVPSRLGGNY